MPRLRVRVEQKAGGLLGGRAMNERFSLLLRGEERARKEAAAVATQETQKAWTYKRTGPPPAPRPGRSFSTRGKFPSFLRWVDTGSEVAFDARYANRRVPYWIIQEIGTGQSARIRRGGETVRRGRPTRDEAMVRSPRIPSQRGRPIPLTLAFGTREGGVYSPPGTATGQQLYLRSRLRGGTLIINNPRDRRGHQLVISREIQGQGFVQKGGTEGFRKYRQSVLAAARHAFAGQPYRRP